MSIQHYTKQLLTAAMSLLCLCIISAQSDTDVLMTVGTHDVTVGEFRYIYEKNNGDKADYTKASVDEYLDLYTKFKLKVAKAKDMKLDTITSLQEELAGYRSQLANSFLTDREVFDKVIAEIAERQKQDVRVSHILISVKPRSADKEKTAAIKKLNNIKQQLREGKSFADLAKEYSEDKNTKDKGGDLGYTTANLPSGFYDLENAMYNLDINEISDPIETKLGYHLVRVTDKRAARGMIEVAHIFRKVDKSNKASVEKNKKLMDSLYVVLQAGADFGSLANQYSEDKTTMTKGGVLPPFGIAVYDSKFEDTAFGLNTDGQISRPILTSVGYHIIKRISKPELLTTDQLELRFKDKISRYDRYDVALDDMIHNIKEESRFRERPVILKEFTETLDEEFYSHKWQPSRSLGEDVLLSFGPSHDQSIKDFAAYAKKQTRLRSQFEKTKPLSEAVNEIYQEFVKEKAYEYERATLETKYPEFKALMREYSEGILLFEATKINVWDKANTDTVGLYQYYEQNKGKYIFEQQAKIGKYIVNTTDKKQLKKVMKCAKKHDTEKTLARFNKDGIEMLEYSEVTVEPGSKELVGLEFKQKSISEPIIDKKNNKSLFKKVVDILPSRRKSLKESRGYVVADYQDQLEKQWITNLRKDYPVKVNDKVYNALVK